ncbi:NAD-dependent epimerase/dehydratase family protein [Thermodesulfobacteriota bacterium]
MKVGLLGCYGFIGSHILKTLSDQNIAVVGIDRYATVPSWRKGIVPPNFKAIAGDLIDEQIFVETLDTAETIIFAAGNPVPATHSFDLLFGEELRIVINLLEFMAKENPNARLVFISSGGTVYGHRPEGTFCHEDEPLAPVSFYGVMKAACENSIRVHARQFGLGATILRVANPYGPGQNPNANQGLIPVVIKKLLAGEKINIWGDGHIYRDFFFVEDLCSLIAMIVQKNYDGGIYNVGSGKGTSVLDIVKLAAAVTGCTPDIQFHPPRPQDLKWNALSIEKTRKLFGWEPGVPLEEGIVETTKWIKMCLENTE